MEDQDNIEEKTDAVEAPATSPSVPDLHSEDSRNSEDSYPYNNNDDPMNENSYEGWGSDAYYNERTDDDTRYESCEFIDLSMIGGENVEQLENVPSAVETIEETFEENNNDPNNNMDSIELNAMEQVARSSDDSAVERSMKRPNSDFLYVCDRFYNPKPGCSKDCQPALAPAIMPEELTTNKDTMLEKTRHILSLVSTIHRDSVFDALCKDDKVPIKELKLWDLIPEGERREYLDVNSDQDKEPRSISAEECEEASGPVDNTTMQLHMEWTMTTNSVVKRGPADDICTIQPKKSSSDPDLLSINAAPVPSDSLSKVSSPTSQIGYLPPKPINQGAIPKVRDEFKVKKKSSKTVDATTSKAKHAVPMPELRMAGKIRPEFPIQKNSKLDVNSASSGSVLRAPILKYRTTKSTASKTNTTALEKVSKPCAVGVTQLASSCVTTANGTEPMPKSASAASGPVLAGRGFVNQQRQPQIVTENRYKKSAPNNNEYMHEASGNWSKQPVPVIATPIYQYQRPTEVVNRPNQVTPTTLPIVAATIPIDQQRQTKTVNRVQQVAPMAAAPRINQQQRMYINNLLPRAQSHSVQPTPAPVNEQSTKRIICKEMYYKLRNIFPNVDRKYIKKLCPPDWGPGNKDDQMAPIIEHLLTGGESLPQEEPIVDMTEQARSNVNYKSADDLYEFFIGIFPDGDPHYLRDFAVKNLGNDGAIKNFVDTNLERREYPTREQYMARLKITEQQKRYTTGFDVKQFLSIIPDPTKHFMDPQRKCTHQTVAFEFLKSHFNKLRVTTISRVYTDSRYNLSIAAQNLEILTDELKSKRGGCEMPTEDILLLQEIAFVKHKEAINKYIEQVKKREDDEFKALKAMNQLLECQCCYDSECVPSKCSECNSGHIFCNNCVITGTSAKMGEDQTRIYCFVNCGSEFSLSVLQQVLAPTTFSILLKKRQAAEVIEAGLEGLVSCPFCHFASIPPEGDKIFKCLNPECTKESCRLCKELSHVPLKCDEVTKTENARRYIEEKMTQALARNCYKCRRAFFKEEGCNKITCPCGAMMCYLCDAPIKDYTHFRGQGSNDRNLCPLYTDTIRMDAVAVRKVAEEAQREMLKRNPNINIDTTGLLPDIPHPINGPHNAVLNADELPRRAQRVLDLPPL